jgi:cellobiose phosphorylase
MYVAVTQWILGIRPTHGGLRIAPAIPSAWPGFSARRLFRGTWYDITVRRQGPGSGVSLTVDGRPVPGDVVALPAPGTSQVVVLAALGD